MTWWRTIAGLASVAVLLAATPSAYAIVDVSRASDGVVWVRGDDTDERVTIDRADDGRLRIAESSGAPTSSDASCATDAATSTILCDAATTFVRVVLAGGTDTAEAADGASIDALIFNGGAGTDTVTPTGATFARVWDPTTTDTIDLSTFDGGITGRWNTRHNRMMLTCSDCSQRRTVLLSGRPGTVTLTDSGDDVDLRSWKVLGHTTWRLGDGSDRFFGSQRRRSTVYGGDGIDKLVSFGPRDTLRGEGDADRLADFGGRGDIVMGGAGIDAISSMDGQRDTIDGGADRDFCLAPNGRTTRHCDPGTVRSFDDVRYMPLTTQAWVLRTLGIS